MNDQKYRENRTRAEIDRLLHYGHAIPISHGFTAEYVSGNYPGWSWNQLISALTAAGVLVRRGGSPSACHPEVVRVQFDSEWSWRVEWTDGCVTCAPDSAGTTRPQDSVPGHP